MQFTLYLILILPITYIIEIIYAVKMGIFEKRKIKYDEQ